MSNETIERELAELRKRVARLEARAIEHKPVGAWRELIGWEKDDETFREAVRLGAEWRARANAEGR